MNSFLKQLSPLFVYTLLFSVGINILLLTPSIYMMLIYDRVMASRNLDSLYLLSLIAAGAMLTIMLLEILRARLLVAVGVALETRMGPRIMRALLQNAALYNTEEYQSGMRDLIVVRNFLTGTGIFAVFEALWLPFYLAIIFIISVKVGIYAVFCTSLLMLVGVITEKMQRRTQEDLQAHASRSQRFVDHSLRNAEVIAALGMQGNIESRWKKLNRLALGKLIQNSHTAGTTTSVTRCIRMSVQISMMGVGTYMVLDMDLSSGVILAATFIMSRALAPVEMIISSWGQLIDTRLSLQRLQDLLRRLPEEREVTELPEPRGQINLENVVFGFSGQRPIIKGLSLEIRAGSAIGIIGASGSGKSTLARLLTGVWRPAGGSVRLDGGDIGLWPRDRLGPFLGYLPQDVELFSGTVADNISRLGEHDSAAIVEAAQRAQVHELILRLPLGYETPVDHLSGGQKQRVALARALFGQPRLVVLDEPNSNLDGEGELALQETLRRLRSQGVTVIMITHRPNLLNSFDKILVLRDGMADAYAAPAEVIARYTQAAAAATAVATTTAG